MWGFFSATPQKPPNDSVQAQESTPSGSDLDCTVVLDQDSTQHAVEQPKGAQLPDKSGADSNGSPSQQSGDALQQQQQPAAIVDVPASNKDADVQSLPSADAAAAARSSPAVSKPRTYYIDWLRVFLTLLVVVHHCVVAYQSSYAWAAKRGDIPLFLFSELFVNGNQAYFMTLFFFLSGLYVPGSYKRKGPAKFLLDRTLRLVLPCIIYSFLAPPFILWWNDMAKDPFADPGEALAKQFRAWLKPTGWPTTYILPTGPPWFVWMLWCFNVAYALLKASSNIQCLALPCWLKGSSSSQTLPQRNRFQQEFSNREMIQHGGVLTAILFVLCFAARMLDRFVFGVNPLQFVQRGPFVSFMPDLFPTYVVAFALGIYSGPASWNVLARLPDKWGSWGLWVGGCWWLWAGWLLNLALRPAMVMQRGVVGFVLSWALRTFVEQSFCVVWSIGLLVVFRMAYNVKPGLIGTRLVTGAYGAYLVHPVVLILFARVLMAYSLPSAVVNAAVIALPSVVTSWLLAIMLRMLPGADHVL